MISSTTFWAVTTAIIILIAFYIILLVKLKSVNESSDFSGLPEIPQETRDELLLETSENLPVCARNPERKIDKMRARPCRNTC